MIVKCLTQEHNAVPRPGLEPGLLDLESRAQRSFIKYSRSCVLTVVVYSLPHHKARTLYACHNSTDVQDSCVKRPGARLQSKCVVFRWNQVQ